MKHRGAYTESHSLERPSGVTHISSSLINKIMLGLRGILGGKNKKQNSSKLQQTAGVFSLPDVVTNNQKYVLDESLQKA